MITTPLTASVKPVRPLSASLSEAFASLAATHTRSLLPGVSALAALPSLQLSGVFEQVRALQATVGLSALPVETFAAVRGITASFERTNGAFVESVMGVQVRNAVASALSPNLLAQIAVLPRLNVPKALLAGIDVSQFAGLRVAIPSMPSVFLSLPRLDWFRDLVARSLFNWRESIQAGLEVARSWGRRALRAALAARDAFVQQGRLDLAEAFVREWLGLKFPSRVHVEAAVDALLEPGWEPVGDDLGWSGGSDLLDDLGRRVARATRARRSIGDTQINGRAVAYLDQPLRADGQGGGATLLDTLATLPADPIEWGFEDRRLNAVLPSLTEDERRVCLVYGGDDVTWHEAALDAGLPAEFGESVRRKRERLVKEMSRRETARRTTSTGGR